MRKRELVDGVVGPRTREAMDQMLCMNGMTLTEKVDFLMSRNRELRAENDHLQTENAKLCELVRDMYAAFVHGNCYRWCEFKEPCNYIDDGRCQWYDRMCELGVGDES